MQVIKDVLTALDFVTLEEADKTLTVTLPLEKLHETATILRNEPGVPVDFLIDMIGLDNGDSLGICYYLSSTQFPSNIIVLKVQVEDRENPLVPTVTDLWDVAGIYEREIFDFFGIRFVGHPDLRHLFLRTDWNGFPLRKDYDASPEKNPIPFENDDVDRMEDSVTINMEMGKPVEIHKPLFGPQEFVVNFGPQHPSMHGVLHLRVALEGEEIKKIDPNFGYIHRGVEKMCESYTYPQILHLTDRLDYLSGTMNRHCFALCCEKALELEVPERAHYIRTIFDELTRIASHLLGWGCMAMDMGSITAFVYGMRDREKIMDIFEETAGGRLMVNYAVIGGVAKDIHPNFQKRVKEFIVYMRKMLKEHHLLFTGNPIARGRMKDVGMLSKEKAISLGVTGPSGRASGWSNDIRKIDPYAAYRHLDFNEILRQDGETFDRYIIRLDEIEESLRIIEQLIDNIPGGSYAAKTKAIIRLPEGEYFQRVEGARGEFDVYINSKGDKNPYRVKFRSPSMTLAGSIDSIARGYKVADLIMIGASLDYVIPCIDR